MVGIGTKAPEGALHVMQSSTSVPVLQLSDTGVIDYKYTFPDTTTLKLEVAGAASRTFQLNNSAGGVFNLSLDGAVTASQGVVIPATKTLWLDGGSDTGIREASANILRFVTNGRTVLDINGDGASVFNEDGNDLDFRFEGDSDANLLFLNAGTDKVGIGTTAPSHKLTVAGAISASGAISATGTFTGQHIYPHADDTYTVGRSNLRFEDGFFTQTTVGGIFEANLKTDEIGDNPTGTIVVWEEDKLVPCDKSEDELVMGVIKQGKDEPIVLGAEPVLVTGKVDVGDYIVTSDKVGHGKSIKRGYLLKKDLFGKVIAQALEKSDDSDSCLIKCMIRKM